MKYTDSLIELPIVMYNDRALDKAHKKEEEYAMDNAIEVPFITGRLRLPYSEIVGYYQTWTRAVSFEEAQEGNLDGVILITKNMGTFLVAFSLEKLERKLNDYVSRRSVHTIDVEERCITE